MTGEHIAVLAAAVAAVAVVPSVMAWRQSSRIEARFLAAVTPAEPEPVSWSESIGWDPAEQLDTIRRQAADETWQAGMVADLTGPDALPIAAELVTHTALPIDPAPQPRELAAA